MSLTSAAGISAFGGLASGLVGGLFANHAAAVTNSHQMKMAMKMAEQQYQHQIGLFEHQQKLGPVLKMAGYKMAGINPIFASDYAGSMPSFNQPVPDYQAPDYSGSVKLGFQGLSNAAQLMMQAKQVDSQVALNSANAEAVRENAASQAKIAEANSHLANVKAVTESHLPAKIKAEILRASFSNMLDEVRAKFLQSQIPINAKQVDNLDSQIAYRKQMIELARKTGRLNLPGFGEVKFDADAVGNGVQDLLAEWLYPFFAEKPRYNKPIQNVPPSSGGSRSGRSHPVGIKYLNSLKERNKKLPWWIPALVQ